MRSEDSSRSVVGGLALVALLVLVAGLLFGPELVSRGAEALQRAGRDATAQERAHEVDLSFPIGTWDARVPEDWRADVPLPPGRPVHADEQSGLLELVYALQPDVRDDLLDTLASLGAEETTGAPVESSRQAEDQSEPSVVMTLELGDGATATYGFGGEDGQRQYRLRIIAPPAID